MVHFITVVNQKCDAFAIGFPNDITCWDFRKWKSDLMPQEAMHICLLTARARGGADEIYVNAEWEKGFLAMPEKAKRRSRARKGWMKRRLKRWRKET